MRLVTFVGRGVFSIKFLYILYQMVFLCYFDGILDRILLYLTIFRRISYKAEYDQNTGNTVQSTRNHANPYRLPLNTESEYD